MQLFEVPQTSAWTANEQKFGEGQKNLLTAKNAFWQTARILKPTRSLG